MAQVTAYITDKQQEENYMKIRSQITVAFLLIIVLITGSMMVLSYYILHKFCIENENGTNVIIKDITRKNSGISQDILTNFGEELIATKARQLSIELSYYIRNNLKKQSDGNYDYKAMRRNPYLRKVASQTIKYMGSEVGFFDLFDRSGNSVINPNTENVEGHNFKEWAKDFPAMWKLVKRSFTESEVKGEYTFIDKANKACRRFMVIRHVPDTNLNICAVVNIEQFFIPVQNQIKSVSEEARNESDNLRLKIMHQMQDQFHKGLLISALIILCFGMLYALWFGSYISRPIKELEVAIDDLKKGKMPSKLPEIGSAETINITRTFNDMTTTFLKNEIRDALRGADTPGEQEKDSGGKPDADSK